MNLTLSVKAKDALCYGGHSLAVTNVMCLVLLWRKLCICRIEIT